MLLNITSTHSGLLPISKIPENKSIPWDRYTKYDTLAMCRRHPRAMRHTHHQDLIDFLLPRIRAGKQHENTIG